MKAILFLILSASAVCAQTTNLRLDGQVAPRTNILFDTLAEYSSTNQSGIIWQQDSGSTGDRNLAKLLVGREFNSDGARNASLVLSVNRNDPDVTAVMVITSTSTRFVVNPLTIGSNDNPDASALVDMVSTTKSFLPPRMTKAQRDAIASPADGSVIYQTDATPGLRLRENGAWVKFTTSADP